MTGEISLVANLCLMIICGGSHANMPHQKSAEPMWPLRANGFLVTIVWQCPLSARSTCQNTTTSAFQIIRYKRFPNYPLPVARLARLGVDQRQQGKGLGKLLLMDALYRCCRLSDEIGAVGVVVDAKHEQAQSFYRQFNFEGFPGSPLMLWLPIAAIARLGL